MTGAEEMRSGMLQRVDSLHTVCRMAWNLPMCLKRNTVLYRQKGCFLLLFVPFVSLILLCLPAQVSTNHANSSLEYLNNGKLDLHAEGEPLGTLVRKIQEK